MSGHRAVVVRADMVTAYGQGINATWEGLCSEKSGLMPITRFNAAHLQGQYAGVVSGLSYHNAQSASQSIVMQMLEGLFHPAVSIPADARLILATTKGEIDMLEADVLGKPGAHAEQSVPGVLLGKVRRLAGVRDEGTLISAACVSSTAALARAASMISSGETDAVLVIACDAVTEFVVSGFSSLMALDRERARPFDRHRTGLNVGEAAAYALLMSEERARREGLRPLGSVLGWGMSSDANHMTGPSRDGSGQARAIWKALRRASLEAEVIASVSAHGTGTKYNDSMEMKALRLVFGEATRPVYSVKGGIGHTMGAAGLVETLLAFRSMDAGKTPPNITLGNVDDEARGWVSKDSAAIPRSRPALTTNSGFGGVNVALVLGPPAAA